MESEYNEIPDLYIEIERLCKECFRLEKELKAMTEDRDFWLERYHLFKEMVKGAFG